MIYVIQTNTSLNNYGEPVDFQSVMFKYSSWKDYKNDLMNDEFKGNIIDGTLIGCLKPRQSKIEQIIVNDDIHIECIINKWFFKV